MCWKGRTSNYEEVLEYIKNSSEEKLKEFETKLHNASVLNYNVYICRYKKDMTFAEISKKLKLDSTARVSESLNAIHLAAQIFFDIVD